MKYCSLGQSKAKISVQCT